MEEIAQRQTTCDLLKLMPYEMVAELEAVGAKLPKTQTKETLVRLIYTLGIDSKLIIKMRANPMRYADVYVCGHSAVSRRMGFRVPAPRSTPVCVPITTRPSFIRRSLRLSDHLQRARCRTVRLHLCSHFRRSLRLRHWRNQVHQVHHSMAVL